MLIFSFFVRISMKQPLFYKKHYFHESLLGGLIGLYREKHGKIFTSEIVRPRALIFGMKHHLMDLYKACSNYTPRAKNGPAH